MKNVIAVLLLLVVTSRAQKPTATRGFAWNWREAQELTVAEHELATSKEISASDRISLLAALSAQLTGTTKEAATTRVKLVDLNGDGQPEVICQASDDEMCSPTGNCSFLIFQRDTTGYKLLLKKAAIQTFTIQRTRTERYSDLILGMHGSATEQGLFVYRCHDGKYRRMACYNANWAHLSRDGEYHTLKEPRITPCSR